MKSKIIVVLLLGFFIIIVLNESCSSGYEREDLLEKYLESNSDKFNNESNFHLLTFRKMQMACALNWFGYDADSVIIHITDSIENQTIFILTDDDYILQNIDKSKFRKNVHFVQESYDELEKYGFYYMPYLYHINNNSIKKWKKINTKKPD